VDSSDLGDFFKQIGEEKKKRKKEVDEIVSNSFEEFFLSPLKEEVKKSKKKRGPKKEETEFAGNYEGPLYSPHPDIQEVVEVLESKEQTLIEKTLGLLAEPSNTKNSDPLTPLDQNFVTFDQLQKHYSKFITRVQQQLSTLGGGGETNLTYMDVPVTYVTSSTYTASHKDYYIGVNYAGAVSITLPYAEKEGKKFVVKDELGEASKGTNRYITIFPSGSDLIDGRDRAILAYDYGSLTFIWRGNSWRVV